MYTETTSQTIMTFFSKPIRRGATQRKPTTPEDRTTFHLRNTMEVITTSKPHPVCNRHRTKPTHNPPSVIKRKRKRKHSTATITPHPVREQTIPPSKAPPPTPTSEDGLSLLTPIWAPLAGRRKVMEQQQMHCKNTNPWIQQKGATKIRAPVGLTTTLWKFCFARITSGKLRRPQVDVEAL